jgi:protein-disulfide isomerase
LKFSSRRCAHCNEVRCAWVVKNRNGNATGAFKASVDADWALSQEKSITAVPTLVLNQDRVVGAQPNEALEGLMEANGVKKRAFHGD